MSRGQKAPQKTPKEKRENMKYTYLTERVNEIASAVAEKLSYATTMGTYEKFCGAYTALFYADAITDDEFDFYAELRGFILDEILDALRY